MRLVQSVKAGFEYVICMLARGPKQPSQQQSLEVHGFRICNQGSTQQ